MAVAGVPCRWRAGFHGPAGCFAVFWGGFRDGGAGVPAGQAGVLAMVMTAGAMRVIVSFGPACANVLGDLDLRARCRFRSVTARNLAIWLVSAL